MFDFDNWKLVAPSGADGQTSPLLIFSVSVDE